MRLKDLTNGLFGYLTVLERTENSSYGRVSWLCRCRCEKLTIVIAKHLLSGHTQSCGCWSRATTSALRLKDLTGLQLGDWLVLERAALKAKDGRIRYVCRCRCGLIKEINANNIGKSSRSCGNCPKPNSSWQNAG